MSWWRASSRDRKSTRLNSSHLVISYAVFCLKKKTHHIAGGLQRLVEYELIYLRAERREPLHLFLEQAECGAFGRVFFFNDPAPTEIYTLSLHDALPICRASASCTSPATMSRPIGMRSAMATGPVDRKSTRLNSSHLVSSYAVFCLK